MLTTRSPNDDPTFGHCALVRNSPGETKASACAGRHEHISVPSSWPNCNIAIKEYLNVGSLPWTNNAERNLWAIKEEPGASKMLWLSRRSKIHESHIKKSYKNKRRIYRNHGRVDLPKLREGTTSKGTKSDTSSNDYARNCADAQQEVGSIQWVALRTKPLSHVSQSLPRVYKQTHMNSKYIFS